ncbi:response regulator transcription factor [Lentzea sp. NPDC034063]|uniref:helix-turn-helix transcriptional regulator n=1 Tax=unclassified Lentzea TaxID=2643253 RepID=UPI0033D89A50
MEPTAVAVHASTPVLREGVLALLRGQVGVEPLPVERWHDAAVLVVAHDHLQIADLRALREKTPALAKPVVLVVRDIREAQLLGAVECGVRAVLPLQQATVDSLVQAVKVVAAGMGRLPEKLIGPLLEQVHQLHEKVLLPNGLTSSGLTPREINVLTLLANGMDSTEVADALWYSERTVKNIIQGMISRLNLRNRVHAVAYAARAGVI